MTGVELELFTDIDMHLFIENSIRGGVSMISHRYARANHPGVRSYDPEKDLMHLIYLDANNLYGYAMSQYLPVRDFKWVLESEINTLFPVENIKGVLNAIPVDSETGYVLEVELRYPHKLHDEHSDYPLAPENKKIDTSMFSPFMNEHFHATDTKKLTPYLLDKQIYSSLPEPAVVS